MKTWDEYPRPSVAVDVAALTVVPGERKGEPWLGLLVHRRPEGTAYWDTWDIPGGFLQQEETLSHAVRRVLRDKCGLAGLANAQGQEPHQLHVFDDPGRDPRGWVVSVAHMIAVPFTRLPPALVYGDDPRVRLARVVQPEWADSPPPPSRFPPHLDESHTSYSPVRGASLFEADGALEADMEFDLADDLGTYQSGPAAPAESASPWDDVARDPRQGQSRPSTWAYRVNRQPSRRLRQRPKPPTAELSSRRLGELISRDERLPDGGRSIGLELDDWPLVLPWDHTEMVALAVRTLQKSYRLNPDPERLLVTGTLAEGDLREPSSFTLTELRQLHEAVEGQPIQRDNFTRMFSRRLERSGSTAGRGSVGRPASTYSHRTDEDEEAY